MQEFYLVIILTLMAGMAMPLGALLAGVDQLRPNWLRDEYRHGIIAFGGALCFVVGGAAFMALDILLDKINTPAGQLAAMLSDFLPESLALGAAFAVGESSGVLLACLMTLQNLPEGFNACRELRAATHYRARRIALIFAAMALLGPIFGVLGYSWLSAYPSVVAMVMLFAAGGICYSVFQDIAPQARLEKHWAPPMGAVLGFMLGMVGHQLTMG